MKYVWIEYIQQNGTPGNILTEDCMIENWVAWLARQGITEYRVVAFDTGHVEKTPAYGKHFIKQSLKGKIV